MTSPIANWIYTLLGLDALIQTLGLSASIIGTLCTIYALAEFMKARRLANPIQRMIATAHIWGQGAVLFAQVSFLIINSAVLSLPPIPLEMYGTIENGSWIVTVILLRKVLRLAIIAVLATSSIHRVWTFHRIIARMNETSPHTHRRRYDP